MLTVDDILNAGQYFSTGYSDGYNNRERERFASDVINAIDYNNGFNIGRSDRATDDEVISQLESAANAIKQTLPVTAINAVAARAKAKRDC